MTTRKSEKAMDHSVSATFAASQAEATATAAHDARAIQQPHPQSQSVADAANASPHGALPHNPQHIQAAMATISFLRMEADLAEERAKCLRHQANVLEAQFAVAAPLDANGMPKYKGKKRGRKPKPKKRQHNPNREKRKHTGYTLFVQETHPLLKSEDLTNAQVVSLVAKKWRDLSDHERKEWKERALATHHQNNDDNMGDGNHKLQAEDDLEDAVVDDVDDLEGEDFTDGMNDDDVDDDMDSPVPPARKKRQKK